MPPVDTALVLLTLAVVGRVKAFVVFVAVEDDVEVRIFLVVFVAVEDDVEVRIFLIFLILLIITAIILFREKRAFKSQL